MAAKKKTTQAKKKATARPSAKKSAAKPKPAVAKKKAAAKKSTAAKKPSADAAPRKPAREPARAVIASPTQPKPAPAPPTHAAGSVGTQQISLGHVMALRPRIHVGFKPSAFADAKRALAEMRYASIEEAARALAEKAIEISNAAQRNDPFGRR